MTLPLTYTVHLLLSPAFTMTLLFSAVLKLSSTFLKTLVCSKFVTMYSLPPVFSWSMWKESPTWATKPQGLTRQWSWPLVSVYCGCRERWASEKKKERGKSTAEKERRRWRPAVYSGQIKFLSIYMGHWTAFHFYPRLVTHINTLTLTLTIMFSFFYTHIQMHRTDK